MSITEYCLVAISLILISILRCLWLIRKTGIDIYNELYDDREPLPCNHYSGSTVRVVSRKIIEKCNVCGLERIIENI